MAEKKIPDNSDEIAHVSYAYPYSNPMHLRDIATLFGFEASKLENAKILELGCGAGGNIIPLALQYPKGKFVGIDSSATQITEATKICKALKLKNIEFRQSSINEGIKDDEIYDYIICHGVISWVSESIRKKIFEICSKNLAKNGIAYISYNTLPGWNMVRSIRDMMLYHSAAFTTTQDKIIQSRLLLNFIAESLESANTPYAEILKQESIDLAKQTDYYLFHEHLEENNKQYYFHEFMKEAAEHKLQYLADSIIASMYVGNMPAKIAEQLATVPDIVRTEQYMDFINNRRFRATILCHNDVILNRNIKSEDIKKFNTIFFIVPAKPLAEVDLNDTKESLKFYFKGNIENHISTTSPAVKAIFYTYFEYLNIPISFDDMVKSANDKLKGNHSAEIEQELLNIGIRFIFQGYIHITSRTGNKANLTTPKMNKFTSYQITNSPSMQVTTLAHETLNITIADKILFSYMNGENDNSKLANLLLEHINKGEINISNNKGEKIEDKKEIEKQVFSLVKEAIFKAYHNNLLD